MSESLQEGGDEGGAPPAAAETEARSLGWLPKEEFRGDPARWRPAEEFLERGRTMLPILQNQFRKQGEDLAAVRTELSQTKRAMAESVEYFRSAERRAYEKAVRELKQQKEAAVEAGDTQRYKAVDTELDDLQKNAPKDPPKPAPEAKEPPPISQVAQAWADRNASWFYSDQEAQDEAIAIHGTLLKNRPNLGETERLNLVTERMRKLRPELFENPRRKEPGQVTPASSDRPRASNARSFANLPQDAKDAYVRFKRALDGKGKPLTEQEWAENYDWDA